MSSPLQANLPRQRRRRNEPKTQQTDDQLSLGQAEAEQVEGRKAHRQAQVPAPGGENGDATEQEASYRAPTDPLDAVQTRSPTVRIPYLQGADGELALGAPTGQ